MKLLKKEEIRHWDEYTIRNKPISSTALMEEASRAFTNWFMSLFFDKSQTIYVFCGGGNNGGDGLCVARMLRSHGYQVQVHLYLLGSKQTEDNIINEKKLEDVHIHSSPDQIDIDKKGIIIDAILGSGISGPLRSGYLLLVQWINTLQVTKVSIDIPSGLDPDNVTKETSLNADHVLSFEIPKLSFFYDENKKRINQWDYRSIGLSPEFLDSLVTPFHVIARVDVKSVLYKRRRTQSKADFGFGQLCGGSQGMYGSIILGARASMRCGVGRLTVTIPNKYAANFIGAVPEVMVYSEGNKEESLTHFTKVHEGITAVAVGPGLGTSEEATTFMDTFLKTIDVPCILDADALNIIARNNWIDRIPENAIITPHRREFSRLFGESVNHKERLNLQMEASEKYGIYIILKGSSTSISSPKGNCYFNQTGNVGMATAGSGDVLTGILLAFLAQNYTPLVASKLGVFIHGEAGDLAASKIGQVSLIASDIVDYLPETLKNLYEK